MDLDKILGLLEEGLSLKLATKNGGLLEVNAMDRKIEVRILDLDELRKRIPRSGSKGGMQRLMDLAKELDERGYTVDVFNGSKQILRMGKDAKPGLLGFFGPFQVIDLKTLLKLAR